MWLATMHFVLILKCCGLEMWIQRSFFIFVSSAPASTRGCMHAGGHVSSTRRSCIWNFKSVLYSGCKVVLRVSACSAMAGVEGSHLRLCNCQPSSCKGLHLRYSYRSTLHSSGR
ncbi:hypothetical protein O6H91_01G091700 [Diphasiastrum complanatum]|uniref:Uncharacterized protein n=1 Tax=Diphasiastrum complanatum TaxID=34168 RepID=A0ACC2ET76_DIPCM|nr:hypothetical protein O6H91_01G091700 [Diphasiastrum complanatum]